MTELTSKMNVKYKYTSFAQQLSLINDVGIDLHFSTTMEKQINPHRIINLIAFQLCIMLPFPFL